MGPFFFNDGTLTGATIANQFMFVVMGCESIGCQILGTSMDAGGCNARFVDKFVRSMKTMGNESWLDKDQCCVTNFWDLQRLIFFWYCVTHLMKSFRGQLEGSQEGRANCFNISGVNFGWNYIHAMYEEIHTTTLGSDITQNLPRITEAAAYPMNHNKMNVSLVKRVMEHKTIAFGISEACKNSLFTFTKYTEAPKRIKSKEQLTPDQLKEAAKKEIEKLNYPFTEMVDEGKHHLYQRHGENLAAVDYLRDLAWRREQSSFVIDDMITSIERQRAPPELQVGGAPAPPQEPQDGGAPAAPSEPVAAIEPVRATDSVVDDTDDEDVDEESICSLDPEENIDDIKRVNDDDHDELGNLNMDAVYKMYIERKEVFERVDELCSIYKESKYERPTSVIHSDLYSLKFLAWCEALFINLFMSRDEKFTRGNIERYKTYSMQLLKYLEEWKLDQVRHKRSSRCFLNHITYKNVRVTIPGFVHFCEYALDYLRDKIEGFEYIPAQADNTTPIEGVYSRSRSDKTDTGHGYAKGVTTRTNRGIMASLQNESASYDKNDLVEFSGKSDTGPRVYTAHRRNINKMLDDWRTEAAKLPTDREPPSRFGNGNVGPVYKSELLKPLGEAMSTPCLGTSSYLQLLMENDSWICWFRLSTKSAPRMKWFNATLTADQSEFDSCCQHVMRELFTMFESDCHNIVTSFEKAYFDYIRGDEFKSFYETKLPECMRANRECALYLVDSLKGIFESWFGEDVAELISKGRTMDLMPASNPPVKR